MAEGADPVLVVGHASRDVTADDPRGWRLGGSSVYVALTLARLGLGVRAVVGLDDQAAGAEELATLERAGVDLQRVTLTSGPVFRNVETPEGRRQDCLSTGPPLVPSDVPERWRTAAACALVPVLGELSGDAWTTLLASDAVLAVGWQGLLREARAGGRTVKRPPSPDPILACADLIVVGTDDIPTLTRDLESQGAVDSLSGLFPRPGQQLVVTASHRGGRLFLRTRDGWDSEGYGSAPAAAVDWTGAGDVFLAAYLAAWLRTSLVMGSDGSEAPPDPSARLRFAALAAAMSIEGLGISSIPTRDELVRRREQPAG